jgi:purine-binding chemotaxis protein CheW
VRWRTAQGKRPWLAGTISARLCALLDTDALAQILEAGMPASG